MGWRSVTAVLGTYYRHCACVAFFAVAGIKGVTTWGGITKPLGLLESLEVAFGGVF